MDVSHLIHPVFIVRDDILQILNQTGDSVVVGKLVEHVRQVERDRLYQKQVGDPLVVGMVHGLKLKEIVSIKT